MFWRVVSFGLSAAGLIVGWFAADEERKETIEKTKNEVLLELKVKEETKDEEIEE